MTTPPAAADHDPLPAELAASRLGSVAAGDLALLKRRHDLMQSVARSRYLHRLVRAAFDLSVARATMADDPLALELPDTSFGLAAPANHVLRELLAWPAGAGTGESTAPSMGDLTCLLQSFAQYEEQLSWELDDLTTQVVAQLRRNPQTCLG